MTGETLVLLANPLSSDMDVLRPGLIPGLLDALRHNLHHKSGDVALFEIGRVFKVAQPSPPAKSQAGRLCHVEERRLAIALTGRRYANFWTGIGSMIPISGLKSLKGMMDVGGYDERTVKFDAYDLKGFVEEFLEQFGLRGVTYSNREEPTSWFGESATIHLGGKLLLGEMGLLSPFLARKYDLRDPVLLAELNFDTLLARRNTNKSFKPLPQFPSVRRDIASAKCTSAR